MNLRKLRVWLLLFTLTPLAAAQFTLVSGTVVDPSGLPYANGTITPTLISSGSPTLSGAPYTPPTQPVGLSQVGGFAMQLADNTQLLPGGSQWQFLVCSAAGTVQPSGGKGPVCFTTAAITISGASQSITAQLTAAALALTISGAGSGTVSPNNGSVGAVANYAAAGGSTTVGPSTGVTAGTNELDVGVAGTASGAIGFNGSTSGKATCTAPAVAGTATNAVNCTNIFSGPGYAITNFVGAPSGASGLFGTGTSNVILYSNSQTMIGGYNGTAVITSKPFNPAGGNKLFVTSNFTTAANTSLQTITGLAFTHVSTNAINWNFHCSLAYSQATGTAAVAFGIQAATNAPTNIFATGKEYTAAGTVTTGVLATLTTTTATAIVSGTPGATATNLPVELDGTLELPASANTINFMVSTATSGDAVTVLRGSYCMIF